MHGSYALMAALPEWVWAGLIIFFTVNILFIGRFLDEGFEYNISWASQQGDIALAVIIMIAVDILRSGSVANVPGFEPLADSLALVWLLRWVVAYLFRLKQDTKMDAYHNLVVVPLFIWLLTLSAPVIWRYGSSPEHAGATLCAAVWVSAFIFDAFTGRLQQRPYLRGVGVEPLSPKWNRTEI